MDGIGTVSGVSAAEAETGSGEAPLGEGLGNELGEATLIGEDTASAAHHCNGCCLPSCCLAPAERSSSTVESPVVDGCIPICCW